MRQFIIPLLAFVVNLPISAQSLVPDVIAAGGDHVRSPGFGSIAWTLGEPVTETFGDAFVLTQGFHQVFEGPVSVQPTPALPLVFGLYPNPAGDCVYIRANPLPSDARFMLSDLTGRIILSADLVEPDQRVALARLPAGTYLVTVRSPGFVVRSLLLDILHP